MSEHEQLRFAAEHVYDVSFADEQRPGMHSVPTAAVDQLGDALRSGAKYERSTADEREASWCSKMVAETSIAMGDKSLYDEYEPEERWMLLLGHLAGRSQTDGYMQSETEEAE